MGIRKKFKTLTKKNIIMKTRYNLETYTDCKRDVFDKRKKISFAVFSYFDENGIEYRKSFSAPPFTPENEFFKIAPKFIN